MGGLVLLDRVTQLGTDTAVDQTVLDHDDDVHISRGSHERSRGRNHPVRMHHGDGVPILLKEPTGLVGLGGHGTHTHQQDPRTTGRRAALEQDIDDVEGTHVRRLLVHRLLACPRFLRSPGEASQRSQGLG